jgi:MFS family permease
VLALGVQEPAIRPSSKNKPRIRLADIKHIGRAYWRLISIAMLLTLARFSEAFLVLKAQASGLPVAWVPMVLVVMSIVYAIAAYPAGILSDRTKRSNILVIGIGFLMAADLVLGYASNLWMLALGVSLWGLHMGFSQGLLASMISDISPEPLRATAYGVYSFCTGIAMLLSSIIAGIIWDGFGSSATFFSGAALASASMLAYLSHCTTKENI